MTKYIINDSTLTEIADAIREKTGSPDKLYPGNMPGQIRNIVTGGLDTTGIDQGVIDEAIRVARSINNKKTANSITFIAISDMHEMGDGDHTNQTTISENRLANIHAGQGAELIAKQIKPDFFVNLGDLAWGPKTFTTYDMVQSITNARVKTAGLERLTTCLATPGNHDIGYNSSVEQGAGSFDENIVKAMIGNYKYIDFDSKKIRVIMANTADISDGTDRKDGVSGEQLQWFTEALDLSSKSDASNWGILIFSHHPLDWESTTMPLANCIVSYLNGTTYSVTHDGISISKNYSGKNSAKIIGTFHGHVHCFKVANLSTTSDTNPVKRIAIPNACHQRNNEYGRDQNNLVHGEPAADTCPSGKAVKSNIAGQDTAFCVVTIDLDEEIIYADCFGSLGDTAPGAHAGYDRVISYGITEIITYTISTNLSNAASSNQAVIIAEGSAYSTFIAANTGYKISSIKVTMGGVDITSSVVKGTNITISSVTGNIIITVRTVIDENPETGSYTNLVRTALDPTNSSIIFNGTGYKDNTYANKANSTSQTGYVSTGGIYLPTGVQDIYIRGAEWDDSIYSRFYNSSKETPASYSSHEIRGDSSGSESLEGFFTLTRIEDNYFKLTIKSSVIGSSYLYTRYYRFSLKGSGADLIITHDQPIPQDATGGGSTTTTYAITNNLTNVTNSNSATSITSGSAYNATLTANSGYTLAGATVTVTMGGTDITASAYSDGVVTINQVTGAIIITAVAATTSVNYTNLIKQAQEMSSTDIYNSGKGYKEDYRLSSASPWEVAADGFVATGCIPYSVPSTGVPGTIYIKGAAWQEVSNCRMFFFPENKSGVVGVQVKGGATGTNNDINKYYTVQKIADNYYSLTPIVTPGSTAGLWQAVSTSAATTGAKFFRISLAAAEISELIITVDEPIE